MILMQGMGLSPMESTAERRQHRRLAIRLPVEYAVAGGTAAPQLRAVTLNVSTGGVYFEASSAGLCPGTEIEVAMTVPPGDGYSPYGGRVRGAAEILRVEPLLPHSPGSDRVGVAARFRRDLKLLF